jgi:fatty-acid desaturase
MRWQRLLILVIILLSLIPAFYANQWLQRYIQPRRSFGQLLLYILACFALVFGYTFLLVWIIAQVFLQTKG